MQLNLGTSSLLCVSASGLGVVLTVAVFVEIRTLSNVQQMTVTMAQPAYGTASHHS